MRTSYHSDITMTYATVRDIEKRIDREIERLRDLSAFFRMMQDQTDKASAGVDIRQGADSLAGQAVMFNYLARLLSTSIDDLQEANTPLMEALAREEEDD